MKVKELIEKLKVCDPDDVVILETPFLQGNRIIVTCVPGVVYLWGKDES